MAEEEKKPGHVAAPNLFHDVGDFHDKFSLPTYYGQMGPRELTAHEHNFRKNFMQEELDEYQTAMEEGDLAKQFDALIDLVYVALGAAHWHGFDFNEGWRRVHAANMAKERAVSSGQSKRGSKLDVIKPPGWTPPDLSDLVV